MNGKFSQFGRTGSASNTLLEAIYESFKTARGKFYSLEDSAIINIEAFAKAKLINYLFELNERVKNNFIPKYATDLLPRWRRMFKVPNSYTDNEARAVIVAKLKLHGKTINRGNLEKLLKELSVVYQSFYLAPLANVNNVVFVVAKPISMSTNIYLREQGKLRAFLDDVLPAELTFTISES